MENLADKLNSYGNDYWDFSHYREKNTLIKYPAVMVAPMQEQLLRDIMQYDQTIKCILDPFTGSGTALVAGAKLGLEVYGIDINPLAILLTRVKLEGVPKEEIRNSIAKLKTYITLFLANTEPVTFNNIKKWFRDDVILDLSTIKRAIKNESNAQIRRYFWVCFMDTVKKFSNTRTTTFKLHIKEQEKIEMMENKSISYFIDKVSTLYIEHISDSDRPEIHLYNGDSIQVLKKIHDDSIDLICTSPPYGDNNTTVTYGQFSILPLLWIDTNDLELFDKTLLERFSSIDKRSVGGCYSGIDLATSGIEYEDLIEKISNNKKKKMVAFINDYCGIFEEMARVLKNGKRMILTLGNRRVDNMEFQFDILNDRLAQRYGLLEEAMITRHIKGKRMPQKVSCLPSFGSVKSMSKEYVKVYLKV